MKQFILGALLICLASTCFCETGFTVKTRISNPNHYTLLLAYQKNNKFILDSTYKVENGWAVFSGQVDEPTVASLVARGNPATTIKTGGRMMPGPMLQFFLTNETIEIEGDVSTIYTARVSGGKANKEWNTIKKKENQFASEDWLATKNAFEQLSLNGDSSGLKKSAEIRQRNSAKQLELRQSFIKQNPNSIVSFFFLSNMLNELSLKELKAQYGKLGSEFKTTTYGKRINDKIQSLESTAIGKEAVPISKKDINGTQVDLQSLKGKYVLIDFWGSWCGPCRASHPHLKEVYAKYKDQGFEIVGIAAEQRATLEENKKIWMEAIKQDGINWIQVLNNENIEKSDAVKAYGVTAFPTKILLDKDGKIIDRYVGEERERFDAKLKELFGN